MLSKDIVIFLSISIMLTFLLPVKILAESHDTWEEETIIDVSIIGESVINLDSPNTLLRAYVDITNYDPQDGYYFLRIIQSSTEAIISEEEIIIREKSNGEAGADVAHMISEDEISHAGTIGGDYDVFVFTEFGSAIGNATFSIIKPSEGVYLTSNVDSNVASTENEETEIEENETELSESEEDEPELINTKKIPDWVKNIFVLYSYDEITENELINALKFLIEQGIIQIDQ